MLAVSSAIDTVSRSRISPTRTMSGSSRSAARRARAKLVVWAPTSRWLTIALLDAWTNSTGSSRVMMCSWRVRLMRSTMAARVVDLPLPVGPVTRTRPLGSSQKRATTGGMPSCSRPMTLLGICRNTAPTPPMSRNRLTRKRATPGIAWAKSVSLEVGELLPVALGQGRAEQVRGPRPARGAGRPRSRACRRRCASAGAGRRRGGGPRRPRRPWRGAAGRAAPGRWPRLRPAGSATPAWPPSSWSSWREVEVDRPQLHARQVGAQALAAAPGSARRRGRG